jgi:hypothetical protein
MKKLFKYIEPIWLGTNSKLSIRRVLALVFSADLVRNLSHIIHKWEMGKSYADVAMLLGLEAALIAALLSLTTYSAMINKKVDNQSNTQAPPPEE